jgi:hypothetical protein
VLKFEVFTLLKRILGSCQITWCHKWGQLQYEQPVVIVCRKLDIYFNLSELALLSVEVCDGIFRGKHGIFLKLASMYQALTASKCTNLMNCEVTEGL